MKNLFSPVPLTDPYAKAVMRYCQVHYGERSERAILAVHIEYALLTGKTVRECGNATLADTIKTLESKDKITTTLGDLRRAFDELGIKVCDPKLLLCLIHSLAGKRIPTRKQILYFAKEVLKVEDYRP